MRTRLAVALAAAVGLSCAGPGAPGPVPFPGTDVTPVGVDVDAVVALTTGLLRARHGGTDDLWRALEERFGARATRLPEGLHVASSSSSSLTSPTLTLAVDLRALPRCRDPAAGVVVGEPPRVLGCGARNLAMLAAFVVATERHDDVALLVLDAPTTQTPAVVWVAGDGGIIRSDDQALFDLGVVDAGTVDVELRLAGDAADLDVMVVAAGRAVSFRGTPRLTAVLRERERARPRPLWSWAGDPLAAFTSSSSSSHVSTADLVRERCRLRAAPTATTAALRCHLLPDGRVDDVIAGLLRAIDNSAIVVDVEATTPPTATPWEAPLVQAMASGLADEGVVVTPMLEVAPDGALCADWRRRRSTCVRGSPLALHPAARDAVATPAESVEVQELGRVVERVDAVVRALRRSTEGG